MAEIYDIGDKPRLTTTFTDIAGALTDPASVVCRIKTPSGVTWVYTYDIDAQMTKTSAGIYNLDLPLTEAGTWAYKWNGVDAATQGTLEVRRSLA